MNTKIKKALATVTTAGVLLVGGAGVAGAADNGTSTPTAPQAAAERRHPVRFHLRRVGFNAAAQVLGQEPKALLKTMAENGQTLAAVAGDQTDEVITAAVAAIRAEVDAAHAAGQITDEQYDKIVQRMNEHLQDRVTYVVNNWVPKPRS